MSHELHEFSRIQTFTAFMSTRFRANEVCALIREIRVIRGKKTLPQAKQNPRKSALSASSALLLMSLWKVLSANLFECMTKSGQYTAETHGRASLQSGIIRHFLRCLDFVMHSIYFKPLAGNHSSIPHQLLQLLHKPPHWQKLLFQRTRKRNRCIQRGLPHHRCIQVFE